MEGHYLFWTSASCQVLELDHSHIKNKKKTCLLETAVNNKMERKEDWFEVQTLGSSSTNG